VHTLGGTEARNVCDEDGEAAPCAGVVVNDTPFHCCASGASLDTIQAVYKDGERFLPNDAPAHSRSLVTLALLALGVLIAQL
jgi:hypothetical protein